jgi:hypothetical protein
MAAEARKEIDSPLLTGAASKEAVGLIDSQ